MTEHTNIRYASLRDYCSKGSNQILAGVESTHIYGNIGSVGVFGGVKTDNFKNVRLVWDGLGRLNYNDALNQNLRLRTEIGVKQLEKFQVRYSPISANIPVDENTKFYINPHYTGEYNYPKNRWTNGVGAIVGAERTIKKNGHELKLFGEVQGHNLQKIKDHGLDNLSANVGVSYSF